MGRKDGKITSRFAIGRIICAMIMLGEREGKNDDKENTFIGMIDTIIVVSGCVLLRNSASRYLIEENMKG